MEQEERDETRGYPVLEEVRPGVYETVVYPSEESAYWARAQQSNGGYGF